MRVRSEHWEVLLSSCEENPQLITNRFSGFEGRAKGNALWQNIAIKLNSMGFGEKTVDGWRKVSIKNLLIITLCQVPTSSFQWYIQAKPKQNYTLYLYNFQTLTDWKSKTKNKAAAIKREQQKTGGGPPQLPPLSPLEERLLLIMGTKALEGDEPVPELGFGRVRYKLIFLFFFKVVKCYVCVILLVDIPKKVGIC